MIIKEKIYFTLFNIEHGIDEQNYWHDNNNK